jgi:hypothetical protein
MGCRSRVNEKEVQLRQIFLKSPHKISEIERAMPTDLIGGEVLKMGNSKHYEKMK